MLVSVSALAACTSTASVDGDEVPTEDPTQTDRYDVSSPSLDLGFYNAYIIGPDSHPSTAAIVSLPDGRTVIAWAEGGAEGYPFQGIYYSVGARDLWSEPVLIEGSASWSVEELLLFQSDGELTIHARGDGSVLAQGTVDGFTAFQSIPGGTAAQHPDGTVYVLDEAAQAVRRLDGGSLVPSDVPLPPAAIHGCSGGPVDFVFRADGAVVVLVSGCETSSPDGSFEGVLTHEDGAWSAPTYLDARALRPRDGTSSVVGVTLYRDSAEGGQYYLTQSPGGAAPNPAWDALVEIDPWGRAHVAGAYSEDGGASWKRISSPYGPGQLEGLAGAFQQPTGGPVFTDGQLVIWFEPTPGSSWP